MDDNNLTTKASVGNCYFRLLLASFPPQFAVVGVGYAVRTTDRLELFRAGWTFAYGKTCSHDTNRSVGTMEVVTRTPLS